MKRRDLLSGLALSAITPAIVSTAQEAIESRPRKTAEVEGCVALVTGSNRGIGLGFVNVLLERGARRDYAPGRNPANLPDVVALDRKRVVPLVLDVNREDQRRAAAAAATDVTWLINNAAYPGSATATERRIRSASTLDDCKQVR